MDGKCGWNNKRKKLAADMAARSGDGLEISRSIQSTGNVRIRRKQNHI